VKVPIESDDQKAAAAPAEGVQDTAGASQAPGQGGQAEGDMTPEEEAARVEAAKRAGEQAAEEDFQADAQRIRAERDELQRKLDGVADQVDAAKRQAADSANRLARLQADWENYRRRTAQERLAEKERAAEKLVVSLLPVLDDMERASEHAHATGGDDDQLLQFVEGVDAIHDKMYGVLNKEGVEVIDPTGQAFDPNLHQAIGRVENAEVYDETVAQVYQKGYRMGDKVIRSAMVMVSYGGPKRPAPEPEPEAPEAEGDGGTTDAQAQDTGSSEAEK